MSYKYSGPITAFGILHLIGMIILGFVLNSALHSFLYVLICAFEGIVVLVFAFAFAALLRESSATYSILEEMQKNNNKD